MRPATKLETTTNPSCGGRLVSTDGRTLPLQGVRLTAEARGGLARVTLEQRFVNPYDDPLAVTYLFPLPAEGAVSGFAFRIGDRLVVGEVDRKSAARERYEEALLEGRTASLVEQERSSLFTQELGNVPPRAEIVAELTVDQRLLWLDEGAWEWRFPTAVAPRYLGAPGRVPDAGAISVDVADKTPPARLELSLEVRDTLRARPESPSHALQLRDGAETVGVALAGEQGALLDRDLVVRWVVASPRSGLSLSTARPGSSRPSSDRAFGLLTLVPPAPEARPEPVARDLILLLDTSGSMSGEPLAQLQHVAAALVGSLCERDRLEMIEFSNEPRRWHRGARAASEKTKTEALAWIGKLSAGGGTEMRSGLMAALEPLRADAQRQVVLITDGQIGFEQEVIASVLERLPARSRLHSVGVGSAVNRSLTMPAARAGRGLEVVIGLDEDPAPAAQRLLARTASPLVTEVELEGSALLECAPARQPDLFAGAPVLVSLALRPEGGDLRVRGRTAGGRWEQRLEVTPTEPGQGSPAIAALFGRERVEDLEMRAATGKERGLDAQIEKLGLDFQLSTRLTSWVAVSEEALVDPRRPMRRERMPQALPYGMSAEGLGLRPALYAAPGAVGSAGAPMLECCAARASSPVAGAVRSLARFAKGEQRSRGLMAKEVVPPRVYLNDADEACPASVDEGMAARPSTLEARLVLHKQSKLVLEIACVDGLHWDPDARCSVELEDGTVIEAEVDRAHSTASASVGAGQTIRLVLKLDAASSARPLCIRLASDGLPLELKVAG